jgi:predicted transcriptional regulator
MSDVVIRLELFIEDAKLLRDQLAYRLSELDRDLVRTDRHRMQHALAEDVKRLEAIEQRLDALLRDAGG